jgi:hypothetical protein
MQEWQAFEELAVEATILKVGGTELLWHIVDDAVQIHGGYGYIKEYEVERHYRDERVNRIYEGTNEINRLNIPEMIIRRAMRGRINFFEWAEKSKKEIDDVNEIKKLVQDFSLKEELFALELAKRFLIISAQEAFAKFGEEIQNEQELLAAFSDIAIGIYLSESAIARAEKHKDKPFGDYYKRMAQFFVHIYWSKIIQSLEIMHIRLGKGLEIAEKLYKVLPRVDVIKLSREIADETAQRM